jgi:uncharacterized protein (DUF2062 family)
VQRLGRLAKLIYVLLVRIDATPHQVGLGFAIGVVLGVFPSFGLGVPAAILLSLIFRINKAATLVGVFIMNPLTLIPIWTMSAFIGGLITGADYRIILEQARNGELFRSLSYSTYVYIIGNVTLASALAVSSYALIRGVVGRYHKMKRLRRAEKQRGIDE